MWHFLEQNKQVAAMVALLAIAAFVVVVISTRSGGINDVTPVPDETEDISADKHVFSTYTYVVIFKIIIYIYKIIICDYMSIYNETMDKYNYEQL